MKKYLRPTFWIPILLALFQLAVFFVALFRLVDYYTRNQECIMLMDIIEKVFPAAEITAVAAVPVLWFGIPTAASHYLTYQEKFYGGFPLLFIGAFEYYFWLVFFAFFIFNSIYHNLVFFSFLH